MATSVEYMDFVMDQLHGPWALRYQKMFGEYMVYADDRPVLLVCDNTVYVKQLDCLAPLLAAAPCAPPYEGARAHYVLDIEDPALVAEVLARAVAATPLPKPRKKAAKP